ncbi:MAG: DNA topoisomerase IV subunit A [Burkholderiales bacterium]|nr:DNA topoisomerase IV subunit A [Burkholderiales bacterium]
MAGKKKDSDQGSLFPETNDLNEAKSSSPAKESQSSDKATGETTEESKNTDETSLTASTETPPGFEIHETVNPEENSTVIEIEAEPPIEEAPVDPTDIVEQALVAEEDKADELTLAYFASRSFLEYAISVVKGRALPEVSDGQKPVQRRILYAMKRMGLSYDSKQVKSARIVGDVLGKYHPHGDAAAYDAMVRMAQDFTLRYPLVDGQGNFGSADGDGAAHMRYTEARLSKYADLLLDELDAGSTTFVPNYDGAFKEPVLLPARLPFLLLNGSTGIAVGMATEIPSHNMKEVADAAVLLIKNPNATLDDILKVMPAPDFPGGGQITASPNEIREAYSTGYGSITMRARYKYEELARGQWQLVVNELPAKIGAQQVLSEIDTLTNPKPPSGKKTLTAKQQTEKALMLSFLDSVRDESDKNNPVRLVFEPKSKSVNRDEFLALLLSKTSLDTSVKFNSVAIGIDGKPRQKGIIEILSEWITFRIRTVTKRLETRLGILRDRIHVLEGRLLIILNIDDVIHLIREANDPKAELIKRYALTDEQAEDILELKLRQLANLDEIKLQKEINKLKNEEQNLTSILENESKLRKLLITEIKADAKKYGDERRTLVQEAENAIVAQKVIDEPMTVIISEKGFVRARSGHGADLSLISFKLGDSLQSAFECRSTDELVILSASGRAYSVPVSELPSGKGNGIHINSFIQLQPGDSPKGYFAGTSNTNLLIASSEGFGFVCTAEDLYSRSKVGKTFFTVGEGYETLPIRPFTPLHCWVAVLSNKGRLLTFGIEEVRALSKGGKGVELMLMDTAAGEKMVAARPITPNGVVVQGIGRGDKVQEKVIGPNLIESYRGRRRRKGAFVSASWQFTDLLQSKMDEKAEEKKAAVEAKINAPGLTPEEIKRLLEDGVDPSEKDDEDDPSLF